MREVTFPNYFFIDDSMDLNSKSVKKKSDNTVFLKAVPNQPLWDFVK